MHICFGKVLLTLVSHFVGNKRTFTTDGLEIKQN